MQAVLVFSAVFIMVCIFTSLSIDNETVTIYKMTCYFYGLIEQTTWIIPQIENKAVYFVSLCFCECRFQLVISLFGKTGDLDRPYVVIQRFILYRFYENNFPVSV